jgi:GTP-binding protein
MKRSNLVCSFLLIDIRHETLENDLEFMAWMGSRQIPFYLVFTKADKLTHNKRQSAIALYMKVLAEQWEPLPPFIVTSSEAGIGRGELLALIESFNGGFVAEGLG